MEATPLNCLSRASLWLVMQKCPRQTRAFLRFQDEVWYTFGIWEWNL